MDEFRNENIENEEKEEIMEHQETVEENETEEIAFLNEEVVNEKDDVEIELFTTEEFVPEETVNDNYVEEFYQEPNETTQTVPPVDKPKKKKGLKTFFVSAAVIACVAAGVVAGYSVGKGDFLAEKNEIIETTNYAKEEEQVEKIANKEGKELTTQEIAVKAGPAVVGVLSKVQSYSFWGQSAVGQSTGSGVVVSKDGYIVTNYHVIEGAIEVKIVLNSGVEHEAKVVGYDTKSDLAVLKIEATDLTYVTFGDSSAVMVGDRAVAIGNPLGTELMGTVTQGIISAVNRTVTVDDKTMTLLQTDAAINSGNSGGALLNAYGELIGINTIKMAATGVEGLGFAIPSNQVKQIVDDVMQYGYVRGRLVIGVSGTNITDKLAAYYELPVGFYVNEVIEGYGAYLAGIQPGDVIIKCDGVVTENIDQINAQRDKHKVGDTMTITVVRNGEKKDINVKLMEEVPGR